MIDWELDAASRDEILQRDILPLTFPDAEREESPGLILLAGQPGAGRARFIGPLLAEHGDQVAVLSSDELQAFHPRAHELARGVTPEAAQGVSRTTASWLSASIRHARQNRRSLLVEGTFTNADAAVATAARFAAEGFRTRVVVVGSSRAESLLSVTSQYLREVQARIATRFTSSEAHDTAFHATRVLVDLIETSRSVDRLTVVARGGRVMFDGSPTRPDAVLDDVGAAVPGRASAALEAAQSERMSRFDATQWLSELHHVTDFAASRRRTSQGLTELLMDLHVTALREVIPRLHVPADGQFATAMERATAARLAGLRRTLEPDRRVDVAAPVVVPPIPERGGLSR